MTTRAPLLKSPDNEDDDRDASSSAQHVSFASGPTGTLAPSDAEAARPSPHSDGELPRKPSSHALSVDDLSERGSMLPTRVISDTHAGATTRTDAVASEGSQGSTGIAGAAKRILGRLKKSDDQSAEVTSLYSTGERHDDDDEDEPSPAHPLASRGSSGPPKERRSAASPQPAAGALVAQRSHRSPQHAGAHDDDIASNASTATNSAGSADENVSWLWYCGTCAPCTTAVFAAGTAAQSLWHLAVGPSRGHDFNPGSGYEPIANDDDDERQGLLHGDGANSSFDHCDHSDLDGDPSRTDERTNSGGRLDAAALSKLSERPPSQALAPRPAQSAPAAPEDRTAFLAAAFRSIDDEASERAAAKGAGAGHGGRMVNAAAPPTSTTPTLSRGRGGSVVDDSQRHNVTSTKSNSSPSSIQGGGSRTHLASPLSASTPNVAAPAPIPAATQHPSSRSIASHGSGSRQSQSHSQSHAVNEKTVGARMQPSASGRSLTLSSAATHPAVSAEAVTLQIKLAAVSSLACVRCSANMASGVATLSGPIAFGFGGVDAPDAESVITDLLGGRMHNSDVSDSTVSGAFAMVQLEKARRALDITGAAPGPLAAAFGLSASPARRSARTQDPELPTSDGTAIATARAVFTGLPREVRDQRQEELTDFGARLHMHDDSSVPCPLNPVSAMDLIEELVAEQCIDTLGDLVFSSTESSEAQDVPSAEGKATGAAGMEMARKEPFAIPPFCAATCSPALISEYQPQLPTFRASLATPLVVLEITNIAFTDNVSATGLFGALGAAPRTSGGDDAVHHETEEHVTAMALIQARGRAIPTEVITEAEEFDDDYSKRAVRRRVQAFAATIAACPTLQRLVIRHCPMDPEDFSSIISATCTGATADIISQSTKGTAFSDQGEREVSGSSPFCRRRFFGLKSLCVEQCGLVDAHLYPLLRHATAAQRQHTQSGHSGAGHTLLSLAELELLGTFTPAPINTMLGFLDDGIAGIEDAAGIADQSVGLKIMRVPSNVEGVIRRHRFASRLAILNGQEL